MVTMPANQDFTQNYLKESFLILIEIKVYFSVSMGTLLLLHCLTEHL